MQETSEHGGNRGFAPARTGPYKRFFAWLLWRMQDHYGDDIEIRKRDLLSNVRGTVVEIGAGAGANLSLYPPDAQLLLVEPNAHMHGYLHEKARRLGRAFEIREGTAERMNVADEAADFVVCTLALCSVDRPEAALREVIRVLKPGGEFLFLEHVAAPTGTRLRRWQRGLRGLWRAVGDGCTLDRETWAGIEQAGFGDARIERFEAAGLRIVRPHIVGSAVKAGS